LFSLYNKLIDFLKPNREKRPFLKILNKFVLETVRLYHFYSMISTTTSGWSTWKSRYKGAGTSLFRRKIATAFSMLGISIFLPIWRFTYYSIFTDEPNIPHWLFMTGTMLLIIGAVVEGYFDMKLHHRDINGAALSLAGTLSSTRALAVPMVPAETIIY
jgi:hypothetical protein